MATGGGSYKFYERMKKELDVEVVQEDEMECLIVGTPPTTTTTRVLWSGMLIIVRIGFLYSGDSVRSVYVFTYGQDDFVFTTTGSAVTDLSIFTM